MVIPAEGKIRTHVVLSSEVRGGRFRIFLKKKSWTETTETLRRFSAFQAHYIKCKVAKLMGEGIGVLSRLASVAVFSASFFLFFIPWPCTFRTLFSLCQKGTETTFATLEGVVDFLQPPWR